MSQAIAQAGKLKSEIRLAQAISEFGACLEETRRAQFKTLQTRSPPSPADIIQLTEEINRDGARLHRSWQPLGTRLFAILERIQVFSAAGDIIIGGSQNMIASGVWAVVRVSLQLAMNYLAYFDKVSELFMRIGRAALIKQDLAVLFPQCRQLQQFMCEYLIVILNICREVVLFMRKPLFSQLVTSFTQDFKAFERDLGLWGSYIQERASYLSIKSQIKTETSISAANRALARFTSSQATKQDISERLSRLQSSLFQHQPEFDLVWRRERKRGSTPWIFESTQYQAWHSSSDGVLWVTGSLGSGKSVLLANLTAAVSSNGSQSHTGDVKLVTSSFFCNFGNAKSLQARNIIGSIAYQYVKLLRVLTEPSIVEDMAARIPDDVSSFDTDQLADLLVSLLPHGHDYCIVLDALDECADDDVEEVIGALSKLRASHRLRLCLATRSGSRIAGMITAHLDIEYKVSMSNPDRYDEVLHFIDREIDRRHASRPLDQVLVEAIKQTLASKAQGMYLWVALQIDSLFPRYKGQKVLCDADILDMLERLPEDLPRTFDRALNNIADHRYGSRIFEIVASARRHLSLDELLVSLNIEPGNIQWNDATLPEDAEAVVYLCGGGLLSVDEESLTVDYIHSSALQHLSGHSGNHVEPGTDIFRFSLAEANMMMGHLCLTYLNYDVFETRLSTVNHTRVGANQVSAHVSDLMRYETENSRVLNPVVRLTKWLRPTRPPSRDFDVIQALRQEGTAQRELSTILPKFFDYAQEHWLFHTTEYLLADARRFHTLLKRFLGRGPPAVELPWNANDPVDAIAWAMKRQHLELLRCFISGQALQPALCFRVARFISEKTSNALADGQVLGDLVTQWMLCHSLVAYGEHLHVLKGLLRYGADPSTPCADKSSEFYGQTPLEICLSPLFILSERSKWLEALLLGGADPDCRLSCKGVGSALWQSLRIENLRYATLLVEHGANVNIPFIATEAELPDIFSKFNCHKYMHADELDFGGSNQFINLYPLKVVGATRKRGSAELIKLLLERGAGYHEN